MSEKFLINEQVRPEDIIWCVCACLTDRYTSRKKKKFQLKDICFEQSMILKYAKNISPDITDKDVESAMASTKSSRFKYLVLVGKKVRISYMQEFTGDSECPDIGIITQIKEIVIDKKKYNLKSIYTFVNGTYTERMRELRGESGEESEAVSLSNNDIPVKHEKTEEYDKNMILYGPPGTGKTYSTAIYVVAICDEMDLKVVQEMEYADVIERYRELQKDGRVAFTTFHQSYGYEEFIEGIKPVLNGGDSIGYTVEDGVFKAFCKRATMPDGFGFDYNAKVWKVILKSGEGVSNNPVKVDCFNSGKIMYDWKTQEEHTGSYTYSQIQHFTERVNLGDVVVTYAGNGTNIDAIGIVTGDAVYDEKASSFRWSRTVNWLEINEIHNIRELNDGKFFDNDSLQHLKRVGIRELFALAGINTEFSENINYVDVPTSKKYVFVIDEINRGNISKIFGELITLIEDTKREGRDEQVSAVLPYSGETFSVPDNVYILGTMNTADRSIALMDTALRRRFRFVEMMPDSKVLHDILVEGLDVEKMLDVINERISFLYDREHMIGHAFFTGLLNPGNRNVQTLGRIFEKSVIPLLQEYFYEDYQKIQLVLGDNAKTDDAKKFIKDTRVDLGNIFVGRVDDIVDLPEKKYEVNAEAFYKIESYLGIAPGLKAD